MRPNPKTSRSLVLGLLGLLMAAAFFAAGWGAANAFVSPSQRAAAAQAPPAQPVTAKVERGNLQETISAATEIKESTTRHVSLPVEQSPAYVTSRFLSNGSRLTSGIALLAVNGRPLIALTGQFPFYRQLEKGMSGPDVDQLRAALRNLTLYPGYGTKFDANMQRALGWLYQRLGYAAKDGKVLHPSEFLVIPAIGGTVTNVPNVGTDLSNPRQLMITTGALVAQGAVSSAYRKYLKPGTPCELQNSQGSNERATVTTVGSKTDASGNVSLRITPEHALPEGWSASSAIAVIDLRRLAHDALIVPSAAITNSGSEASVLVRRSSEFRKVRVTEIASLDGASAVRATHASELQPGDLVRVS